jgi:hypothetical protein
MRYSKLIEVCFHPTFCPHTVLTIAHTNNQHSLLYTVDLLISDLAHLEEPAAGADVALLDLVGAVHDRRACRKEQNRTAYDERNNQ